MTTIQTISKGTYSCPNSGLKIVVIKIQYSNTEYVKLKASLFSKSGKLWYETSNYKLYWKNISHWYKIYE